jgi:hypothetical protein
MSRKPSPILITIARTDPSQQLQTLIDLLDEKSELPFELPFTVHWPKGARRVSARALLLMFAGYQHLLEKYPKLNSQPAAVSLEPSTGQVT